MTAAQTRVLSALRADPRNRDIFDPLEGRDLEELADSLRQNGVINPVTIRPDGLIIAGEQRYRAARLAGMTEVPVVVLDVPDDQVEVLRIEENLRRRTLKTSETVRATRRLFEIHGVQENKGGRPITSLGAKDVSLPLVDAEHETAEQPERKTVEQIAEQVGKSPATLHIYNTLANLIPSLMTLLDDGAITQTVAYQFAQLSPDDQEIVARLHTVAPTALESPAEGRSQRRCRRAR